MSKEYKEFYRNEYPFEEDKGNDPPPVKETDPLPPVITGNPGGGGGGGGAYGGIGGNSSGGGSGSGSGDGGSPGSAGEKPQKKIVWRLLATLTASITVYNILTDSVSGKIMTAQKKCIKGFSDSKTWTIEAGIIEELASHLDCVVMEFTVDGKTYNEDEKNQALSDFFFNGFLKEGGKSRLTLRTKWQHGHYPPAVSTIYLKIRDVEEDKEEVDNIALLKDFRDTIIVNIENRQLYFDKHVGA